MQPLLTRSDIARYRQIAKTSNDDKLNEMILDAQLLDLQPLLGERLFNELTDKPDEHIELLNGGIYEHNGISYTNYGLKMVLAYFAYARYVMFGSVTDTPFSVVEKLNSDSRPLDVTAKKTMYQLNREAALQVWTNVNNYLIRTKYEGFKKSSNKGMQGLRFSKIR